MVQTRQQDDSAEDWTCPLCTLLNVAKDNRCVACDNERPPAHLIRKSQSLESSRAAATVPDVHYASCPPRGVFFSSIPRHRYTVGTHLNWREEPRLVVNRRCGIGRLNVILDRERDVERERVGTGTTEPNEDAAVKTRGFEQEIKISNGLCNMSDTVESMVMTRNEMERQEEEETTMEVEEPCFNLLGSLAAVFQAPTKDDTAEDMDETKSKVESAEVDAANDAMGVSFPLQYPGFIPAKKVHVEELAIEEKLACAGLDLSDLEEEEEEEEKQLPLRLRQRKEKEGLEKKWVCQICTTLNERTALTCSSCSCKGYIDSLSITEPGTGSQLRWACHICTNLNPPDSSDCLVCQSTREVEPGALKSFSDKTWTCSLCSTLNDPGNTRCEVCGRLRKEEPNVSAGKGRECPVCTNINSPRSTRCEICETCLPTVTPADNFVDLSFSSPARKDSYAAYQDDLENPYVDISQYNDCDATNEAADPDVIEEISDHELSMPLVNQGPLKVRPELMNFEHFVCIEDLRGDTGCRINYSKMFAGQRSNKSYADRLTTRKAQSRKRKQDAIRKEAGKTSATTSRGGKAVRGSNKRKVAAAQRRGGEKVPKTKKIRKAGVSARPASSTTTFSSAINYYDDSAANLGEDLSTMAWEGVGSAGYT